MSAESYTLLMLSRILAVAFNPIILKYYTLNNPIILKSYYIKILHIHTHTVKPIPDWLQFTRPGMWMLKLMPQVRRCVVRNNCVQFGLHRKNFLLCFSLTGPNPEGKNVVGM